MSFACAQSAKAHIKANDFFGGFDSANDVLVQPDGKIVAVGSASNGASRGTGLVRVLP